MTTHTSETSTGRALRPPRAGRSNGQWAVDGRDPLNANEAWKQEDGGNRRHGSGECDGSG